MTTTKQTKLLISLAKEKQAEKRDKSTAISSLKSAKILTKNGNFTTHYSNLDKFIISK